MYFFHSQQNPEHLMWQNTNAAKWMWMLNIIIIKPKYGKKSSWYFFWPKWSFISSSQCFLYGCQNEIVIYRNHNMNMIIIILYDDHVQVAQWKCNNSLKICYLLFFCTSNDVLLTIVIVLKINASARTLMSADSLGPSELSIMRH